MSKNKAKEIAGLMAEAKHEIENLRRRNEILSAKVEVMYSFMQVLHSSPAQRTNQGMCVDVAWKLGEEIKKLTETP